MKGSISFAAAVTAALALAPGFASAQGPSETYRGFGHPMMGWDGGWYGMMLGPLFMILMLAAVIAVAVFLVRWLGGASHGGPQHAPSRSAPLDILKARFARGEIDKTEFEERRRVLGD